MGKRFPGKSPGVWKSGKVLWKTSGKCADMVAKHTDFAGVHLFFAIFCGEQGFVGVGKGGIVFNRVWKTSFVDKVFFIFLYFFLRKLFPKKG